MVILYTYNNGNYINLEDSKLLNEEYEKRNIYVNLTNRCSCACTFCLRNTKEMAEKNSLWLKREPSVEEVIAEFEKYDLKEFHEVIFCGFGEPLIRIDDLLKLAAYLKGRRKDLKIRINTNGLSDLTHKKRTAPMLKNLIDTVSISLNASNAEEYLKITRNEFGIEAFAAMLKFAEDCKAYVPNVVMTVVDVIGEEEIAACRAVCEGIGVALRVRTFE